jgi:hypothetical protein
VIEQSDTSDWGSPGFVGDILPLVLGLLKEDRWPLAAGTCWPLEACASRGMALSATLSGAWTLLLHLRTKSYRNRKSFSTGSR